ncbi:hypothetical protein Daus18300_001690 [Diaporthe australafricana]|uniref:SnoaL-like domain-containing protein n=1 Tax=Diaporthe australafricana TaxID=127596 RepID=A0ABR3XVV1_9PEZI
MSHSNTLAESQELAAKVLANLDHPMHYANTTFRELRPEHAGERQAYLYDRKVIEDLISEYNYLVDAGLTKNSNRGALDELFTADAEVVFPRGKHQGNADLGEWLLSPVSALHRMTHLSSNHSVKFESSTVAHGRSTWQSAAGFHATDISQVFFTGGYYYWSFHKVADDQWKISFLFLDMTWKNGEVPSKVAK